jgi:hypothetical protein
LKHTEADERELIRINNPFNITSSIHTEYDEWAKVQFQTLSTRAMQISDELDEEALWEQGGEEGASQTDGPRYDEMEE